MSFEKFTDKARKVLVLAQDEARSLHQPYVGTEHILLGDRKSTRLNSSHSAKSRMPSSA